MTNQNPIHGSSCATASVSGQDALPLLCLDSRIYQGKSGRYPSQLANAANTGSATHRILVCMTAGNLLIRKAPTILGIPQTSADFVRCGLRLALLLLSIPNDWTTRMTILLAANLVHRPPGPCADCATRVLHADVFTRRIITDIAIDDECTYYIAEDISRWSASSGKSRCFPLSSAHNSNIFLWWLLSRSKRELIPVIRCGSRILSIVECTNCALSWLSRSWSFSALSSTHQI